MPIFAALFTSFVSALSLHLAKLMATKIAMRLLAVGAITALGTGLMLLFNSTVAPLASAMFSTQYGQLLGLVFPPIAGTCVAAFVVLWVACTTYKLQVQAIKITANI